MSELGWRERYRLETAAPPAGAEQRVWQALRAPRRSSNQRLALAFVAAAAAGVLAVLLGWPTTINGPVTGEGFAAVATGARLTRDARTLTLAAGRLVVSVWGQPVTVEAGGRRVELEAAQCAVLVAGERVEVWPVEGVVVVDGVAVEAAPRTRAAAGDVSALAALEAAEAPLVRAEARARSAVEAHAWAEAVRAYDVIAASSSLRAEVALVKRGELELRQLGAPARARATFDEAAARFPDGSLAAERALSALEAAAALADWGDVERRAQAFESAFPSSERLAEVRQARAAALWATGRADAACALAATLPTPPPFAPRCGARER
jgi:hypothetical protein